MDLALALKTAAPYINIFREKKILILIDLELFEASKKECLKDLIFDLTLLKLLDINLTLFLPCSLVEEFENTSPVTKTKLKQAITKKNQCLENLKGLLQQVQTSINSGPNFKSSKLYSFDELSLFEVLPKEIVEGVDYQKRGKISKTHTTKFEQAERKQDVIKVFSNYGYNFQGEALIIDVASTIAEVCKIIQFDKVIFATKILESKKHYVTQIVNHEMENNLKNISQYFPNFSKLSQTSQKKISSFLHLIAYISSKTKVVERFHILNSIKNNLIEELLSPVGAGIMVHSDLYYIVRTATENDLFNLKKLLIPHEKNNLLINRDIKTIRDNLSDYIIIEIDKQLIGAMALDTFKFKNQKIAYLYSIAICDSHQKTNLSTILLEKIEQQARQKQLHKIAALSTQNGSWFIKQGFINVALDSFPTIKLEFFENSRQQNLFIKNI